MLTIEADYAAILERLDAGRFALNERNDCSVRAIALAADIPYHESHAICREYGREDQDGQYPETTLQIMLDMGYKITEHTPRRSFKGAAARALGYYSAQTIGRKYPTGIYFVHLIGHVATMIDGVILDWTYGRRFRVLAVIEITV